MDYFSDQKIIDSWFKNVEPWVKAIERGEISSRIAGTNQAIVNTVLNQEPANLLDVGCGEGWLIKALSRYGIECLGIDVVPEFADYVENAGGQFKLLSYEEYQPQLFNEKFDAIVCNFSLLGKESVENVITCSAKLLNRNGALLVQTIHPAEASTPGNDSDGWRKGSWQGFKEDFVDPAPWYFRTLGSWRSLFNQAGFERLKITEPVNPDTGERLSIIFEARRGID